MGYWDDIVFYSKANILEHFGQAGADMFERVIVEVGNQGRIGEIYVGGATLYYIHTTERGYYDVEMPEKLRIILGDNRVGKDSIDLG